jgi:hypothetical protein
MKGLSMKNVLMLVGFLSVCTLLFLAAYAVAPAAAADDATDFILTPLPKEDAAKLAGDDKDLSRLAEALKSVKLTKYDKADVRVMDKVPFVSAEEPVAIVLDTQKEATLLTVGKAVTHVCLLLAVLDPGKDPLAQLTILRGDGVPTRTKFTSGDNCGPSVGAWDGKVEAKQKGFTAKVLAETKTKDDTPVRLFLLDWRNDNEWYPVSDLKFKLLDPKAKTRFVLLGVTSIGGVKQ